MSENISYSSSGVNVEKANETKKMIKNSVQSTFNKNVLTDLGSFGGLFDISNSGLKSPVLVASADGVGTKLKLAFITGIHNTVGADLVNHCIDDILVQGARPLYFMDYIGTGVHDSSVIASIIEGMSTACKNADMALLGGEMAEMPGFYNKDEYDLAGFITGVVDKDKVIDGTKVKEGDVLIGLASDGLHTNGYSLARKLFFDIKGLKADSLIESAGVTVAEALMAPHRSYFNPVWPLLEERLINGMAHITGGGFRDNIPRSLPASMGASVNTSAWETPAVFTEMQKIGNVEKEEMYKTFNMGIGFILMVDPSNKDKVLNSLNASGEKAYEIGVVNSDAGKVTLK